MDGTALRVIGGSNVIPRQYLATDNGHCNNHIILKLICIGCQKVNLLNGYLPFLPSAASVTALHDV